ncbi:hypothetical protein AAWM_08385 [Aspergillus awamori]|uniref:Uncharacterized protein n=2 Tax=Aspergillus TaxID=5052 RepID=A0A401L1U8_ASPAW|nr:hypothetical protein AAWM_08385 [Aspergillus awamori]
MTNPLLLPEIVGLVIGNIHIVPDLLNCACVNSIWSTEALKKLYQGSLNDMQFRTPDIESINSLFVASRKRFARNMGFVKHLLLFPAAPAIDDAAEPRTRLACFQRCRAMRHRQDAELLLQQKGRRLASLTIPFEIIDQDWSHISDLLLTPTIEFLAIDDYYCEILMASSRYSRAPIGPADKFANFKALTIYQSRLDGNIDELCRLLRACVLQFFHTQEPHTFDSLPGSNTEKLLPCLRLQQNLRALALITPNWDPLLTSESLSLTEENHRSAWPKLKALSLRGWGPLWLEQLPKFEGLQILRLKKPPRVHNITQIAIDNIAKCRHLQVIDVTFDGLVDLKAFLDIAHGCPLLRGFSVMHLGFRVEAGRAKDLFMDLTRALPRLEFLHLSLEFQMDGTMLQDIACHFPRLSVLDLPQGQLIISLASMMEIQPLRHLESMHLSRIYFTNPRRMMQEDNFQSIVAEWRRVFPKLLGMSCPADFYSGSYLQVDELNQGPEDGDGVSVDEEVLRSAPELGFDDYESHWMRLRTKLWRALGYRRDQLINDKVQYMWQTNLGIETIGWPVVPLGAFSDPDSYSTTTNCLR